MILTHIAVTASIVTDESDDQMKKLIDDAGPIAMLFIVLLGVALFFLWRSLNRQMKKIDPALPTEDGAAEPELDSASGHDPDDDDPAAH